MPSKRSVPLSFTTAPRLSGSACGRSRSVRQSSATSGAVQIVRTSSCALLERTQVRCAPITLQASARNCAPLSAATATNRSSLPLPTGNGAPGPIGVQFAPPSLLRSQVTSSVLAACTPRKNTAVPHCGTLTSPGWTRITGAAGPPRFSRAMFDSRQRNGRVEHTWTRKRAPSSATATLGSV